MGRFMHRYQWEPCTIRIVFPDHFGKAKKPREKIANKLTVKQLRELAKSKGVKGYSQMRKNALLALLEPAIAG